MRRWVILCAAALVAMACSGSTVASRETPDGHAASGGRVGSGGATIGGADASLVGGSAASSVADGGPGNGGAGGSGNAGAGGSGNAGSGGTGGARPDWCGMAGTTDTTSAAGSCAVETCQGFGAYAPPLSPPEGDVTIDYGPSAITVLLSPRAASDAIVFSSGTTPAQRIQTFPPATSATAPAGFFMVGDQITITSKTFSGVVAVPPAPPLRLGGSLFPDLDAGGPNDAGFITGPVSNQDFFRCEWHPYATGEIDVQLATVFAPDLFHQVTSRDCSFPASAGEAGLQVSVPVVAATKGNGAVYSVVRAGADPASSGITLVARRRLLTF